MDAAHFFGEDLQVSASGGLAVIDGLDLETQRLIRRLMTAPVGYIWHPEFGAGLPQQVGSVPHEMVIRSIIASQIYLEAGVAKQPAPQITIAQSGVDSWTVKIVYVESISGKQNVLSFDINQ